MSQCRTPVQPSLHRQWGACAGPTLSPCGVVVSQCRKGAQSCAKPPRGCPTHPALPAPPPGIKPLALLLGRQRCCVLGKILHRYDMVLVQEVRDADLSAVTQLMEQLNSVSTSPYDYEISGPLGRENYKERYLFIYRTDVVSVVDTYQYEDPQDVFSREPFILRVSVPSTKVEEFVLVPLHSAPRDAVTEIDALYDVYLAIVSKWGTDNIMFLGDFNADCSYVQPSDWSKVRLRTSDVFKWLLPDGTDTTVGRSDCAYDRIVVCGAKLKRSIVPNSAAVYNFQRALQLEQEEALAVSDHYPVEVKLTA
ncbi:deoxyribonuclease-1-like 2 isoform X1 [Columba livia]|uniref:deoxyribonuclease-1-like 2 isoform X1 n=1 Tax=Columba livia TaxID=8932 RepID=UPI0031BA8BC2